MMGVGNTMRAEKLPEAYSPASRGSGKAAKFERMLPNEGRLVAVGGRSGRLFRETEPGKKGYHNSPSPRTSEGRQRLGVGGEPRAVGCKPIQTSGRAGVQS